MDTLPKMAAHITLRDHVIIEAMKSLIIAHPEWDHLKVSEEAEFQAESLIQILEPANE